MEDGGGGFHLSGRADEQDPGDTARVRIALARIVEHAVLRPGERAAVIGDNFNRFHAFLHDFVQLVECCRYIAARLVGVQDLAYKPGSMKIAIRGVAYLAKLNLVKRVFAQTARLRFPNPNSMARLGFAIGIAAISRNVIGGRNELLIWNTPSYPIAASLSARWNPAISTFR